VFLVCCSLDGFNIAHHHAFCQALFSVFQKKFFRVTVTVNRKREKKEPKKRENLFFKTLKD
jgi:hypothetical protein